MAGLFSKEDGIMSSEVKLRTLRKQKKLTQVECAKYLGIPVRTYQNYETDEKKQDTPKYVYMIQKLDQYGFIDESHGILNIQKIKDVCHGIFAAYDVDYCYLTQKEKRRKQAM